MVNSKTSSDILNPKSIILKNQNQSYPETKIKQNHTYKQKSNKIIHRNQINHTHKQNLKKNHTHSNQNQNQAYP
jgi:hypothetical protein